jgi:hypothetical protein
MNKMHEFCKVAARMYSSDPGLFEKYLEGLSVGRSLRGEKGALGSIKGEAKDVLSELRNTGRPSLGDRRGARASLARIRGVKKGLLSQSVK